MAAAAGTVDPREIARFEAMAARWWDPEGPLAPLHRLNPVRIAYIRDTVAARRPGRRRQPLAGLRLLDIGCGGGLLCEPMARLGAAVVGIDAAAGNAAAAAAHAARSGLAIDYRHATAEAVAAGGERFDVVLAMEVVEHVADLDAFIAAAAACLAPGGTLFLATLNRTAKSFAMAIVGAEYILGWLPRGTHDWTRFVRPAELIGLLHANRLAPGGITGVAYHPLSGSWRLSRDLGVNYMLWAAAD